MRRAKGMKTFDFIQMTISHSLKDPHPKALPACRRAGNATASLPFLLLRHSLLGRRASFWRCGRKGNSVVLHQIERRRRRGSNEPAALPQNGKGLSGAKRKPAELNDVVLGPYAGTSVGLRKEKKLSLRFSLSLLSKAQDTADLISFISRGFMAW